MNILIYIIIFAILFLIALSVLTWVLYLMNINYICESNPNIWCADDWVCNSTCSLQSASPCFSQPNATNGTGLAGCLFGPTSAIAMTCFNTPTGSSSNTSCSCPAATVSSTSNCLSGCAGRLGSVNPNAVCCCKPNSPGCPYNDSNPLPVACLQVN